MGLIAYKNGVEWATDTITTAGTATKLTLTPDRATIELAVTGPGEIVETDNGDPTDRTVFASKTGKAFSGMALTIVRALPGQRGNILVTATAQGLTDATATVVAEG